MSAMQDCGAGSAQDGRWRILLVDDSADDAELVALELSDAGIDAELRCIASEPLLLEALHAFVPQLVLSDMRMPGFSGLRAIELVRELAPSTPFVFLSGDPPESPLLQQAMPAPDARLSKDELYRLPGLVRGLLAR